MTSVAVIVPAFGRRRWSDLAERVALPSVEAQTEPPDEVIVEDGDTLHEARNRGAARAHSEWLCFLDADDRLDHRYLAAMRHAIDQGTGQRLLTPALALDGGPAALVPPRDSIWHGNWLVIGTLIPRDLFAECDGFWDEVAWEDWSLWIRAVELGALVVSVPDAVYEAGPSSGRNVAARPYALGQEIRQRNRDWLAERFQSPDALANAISRDRNGLYLERARA